MKNNLKKTILVCILAIICLSIVFSGTEAVEVLKSEQATIVDFDGEVKIKKLGGSRWVSGAVDYVLKSEDEIKTGDQTYCILMLWDGSTVKLGDNTHVKVLSLKESENTCTSKFKLFVGKMWNQVNKIANTKTSFEVETPHALAAVKGTEFEVRTDGEVDEIMVYGGEVKVDDGRRSMILKKHLQARCSYKGLEGKPRKLVREKFTRWQLWNIAIDRQIAKKRGEWSPAPGKMMPKITAKRLSALRKLLKMRGKPFKHGPVKKKTIKNRIKNAPAIPPRKI